MMPSVLAALRVYYQLNFRCLLDRQVGGFVTFENPTGIQASHAVSVRNAASIVSQAARFDERMKLLKIVGQNGGRPRACWDSSGVYHGRDEMDH